MKKITKIITILLFIFILTSCQKTTKISDSKEFIDLVYKVNSGKIKNAKILDLRVLESIENYNTYSSGHIFGAISYDMSKITIDEFITSINTMYNKKTKIILIDDTKYIDTVINALENAGYKEIYAYTKGYLNLKEDEDFKIKIEERTGIEDCGC